MPKQILMAELLEKATHVEIRTRNGELLADVRDIDALAELRTRLVIRDPGVAYATSWSREPELFLYRDDELLTRICLARGKGVRVEGWRGHAPLVDPLLLLEWLAEHGAPGALEAYQDKQREQEATDRISKEWLKACPESIRALVRVEAVRDVPSRGWAEATKAQLERALGDQRACIHALLAWYGSGPRWNGIPTYERLPPQLLERYTVQAVVDALEREELTGALLDGAARFVSERSRRASVSDGLRATFVRHGVQSGDEDRVCISEYLVDGVQDGALRRQLDSEVRAFRCQLAAERERERAPEPLTDERRSEIVASLRLPGEDVDALWPHDILPELDRGLQRLWACDCVERALPLFDAAFPGDERLLEALAAARGYARGTLDAVALEEAWEAARDASSGGTVMGMRAAEAAGDIPQRRRMGRASDVASAAMAAADPPSSWDSDFLHAARSAEDALVGFDLALDSPEFQAISSSEGLMDLRGSSLPDSTAVPTEPARLAERCWQRQRLAELLEGG